MSLMGLKLGSPEFRELQVQWQGATKDTTELQALCDLAILTRRFILLVRGDQTTQLIKPDQIGIETDTILIHFDRETLSLDMDDDILMAGMVKSIGVYVISTPDEVITLELA